jgi:hypothetical protein
VSTPHFPKNKKWYDYGCRDGVPLSFKDKPSLDKDTPVMACHCLSPQITLRAPGKRILEARQQEGNKASGGEGEERRRAGWKGEGVAR